MRSRLNRIDIGSIKLSQLSYFQSIVLSLINVLILYSEQKQKIWLKIKQPEKVTNPNKAFDRALNSKSYSYIRNIGLD